VPFIVMNSTPLVCGAGVGDGGAEVGGGVVDDGDRFVGKKGSGRFLNRGPSQAPAGL
jgi:hypothetical protein